MADHNDSSDKVMEMNLKEDYERETRVSYMDCLTGLYNHGIFHLALDNEIKRSCRYERPFTLALIDIDHFAMYNSYHGSVKGDMILREMAGIIQNNIREADIGARYSGDVFAIILLECTSFQAKSIIERIRHDVEMLEHGHLTVSIGLADFPAASTNKGVLIKKAQEALLRAKMQGKNSISIYRAESPPPLDHRPRVLIVDDEPRNIKVLEAFLIPFQYEILKAGSGEEALSIIERVEIDLVLLDVMMPRVDGFEVCRHIKGSERTRMTPVIMVTALDDTESKVKALDAGADDFLTKPPNKMELMARVRSLIKVKALNSSLTSLESVLFSLANTVEAKDEYTRGHTRRVAELAVAIGKKMGLTAREIREIKIGGIIHDIGKIGIPKDILNKPGKLNSEEFEIMKKHPAIGYTICLPLKQSLGTVLDIIHCHHEKLDGSGYPRGLIECDIPIGARVMTVADIYDALTSDRPYRKAMAREKALEILRQEVDEGKLAGLIVDYLSEIV